jgi:hypothetical protein
MLEVSAVFLQFKFTFPDFSVATLILHSSSTGWGPWSNAPTLLLRHYPPRTIRPPPSTVAAELQWGELCWGALAPERAMQGQVSS